MKIFILSNELFNLEDPSFKVELSEEGKINSQNKIKNILSELKIDVIYSSPFIRTLQTVFPYASSSKKNIKIDYSLSEVIKDKKFIDFPDLNLTVLEKKNFLIDKNYNSLWNPKTLKYKERNMQIKHRVKMFLSNLDIKYEKKKINILICSHINICEKILNILSKNEIEKPYELGKICSFNDGKFEILN
tara:strand:- start:769 stop:1335 length:567 start_codon:yes stop_codon:yes gene_type:complete